MFTVAKIIVGDPEHRAFLKTNLFVFDEESKRLAIINVLVNRQEIIAAKLLGCDQGPRTFQEILRELLKGLDDAPEATRLIYKEHIHSIDEVEDFAIEHFKEYVEGISVMGTHEDIAEMLRKCFPKKSLTG